MTPSNSTNVGRRFAFRSLRPHVFVLVCGALFGTGLAFLSPPLIAPDEFAHFCRAYHCSEGKLVAEKRDGKCGDELPAAIARLDNRPETSGSQYRPISADEWDAKAAAIDFSREPTEFIDFRNTALYSPVPYLPQAAVLRCSRQCGMRLSSIYYLCRLANLAAYLALAAAAVYVAPIQKWAMALIALTPMAMYLAASISADGMTIGLALLAIALTMDLALSPQPAGASRLVPLGVTLVLLGLSKQAYCGMALLILAVPAEKFSSRGHRWLVAGLIIGATLVCDAAWSSVVRGIFVPILPFVDPPAQARWVASHPISFTGMIFNVLYDTNRYQHMIGYFERTGPMWWKLTRILYWGVLLLVAVLDGGKRFALSARTRLIVAGTFIATIAMMETAVYLTADTVGGSQIEGIQPRYFLPAAMLLLVPIRARLDVVASGLSRRFVPAAAVAMVLIAVPITFCALVAR
jgi:uncharacterized membrane protein